MTTKLFFLAGLLLAASGLIAPPFALLMGLLYGLILSCPYQVRIKKLTKILLQASIVALGFGLNLGQVLRVGKSGLVYTAFSILIAVVVGVGLGRLFRVGTATSFLIIAGTAICGGSAIAAVAPIIEATEEEIAVSLGTVFTLNCLALFLFPMIGWALHLSETQFGLWSALAIHDTSSVVGASAKYGAVALSVATTVKLARTLWIVPVSIATAVIRKSNARIQWPWFILFFCGAAVVSTYLPVFGSSYSVLTKLGRLGLTITLYLVGTGVSRGVVRHIGLRPFLQGFVLWAIVALASVTLILSGWIHSGFDPL